MNVSTELMYTLTLCNTCATIQTDFAARALKAVEGKKRCNFSWVPTSNTIERFLSRAKITLGDFEGQMFLAMNQVFWTVETVQKILNINQ